MSAMQYADIKEGWRAANKMPKPQSKSQLAKKTAHIMNIEDVNDFVNKLKAA
jgi:hypothetical protein